MFKPPDISPQLRVLSLGAGIQSTATALMAAHGEITPMPDCAIFADTQWEPRAVYDHLKWLMSPNLLPFPVHVVTAGNLREKILLDGYSDVPFFTKDGMGRRQCTKAFKLYPIRDKIKQILGVSHGRELPPNAVEVWVGISTDEASRAKPASVKYLRNRWPLIEANMSRADCISWLGKHEYIVPPKSACLGCPFHNDAHWNAAKKEGGEDWTDPVFVDNAIRTTRDTPQYIHRSCQPLSEVDFDTLEDKGQLNMFNMECEGMCGV